MTPQCKLMLGYIVYTFEGHDVQTLAQPKDCQPSAQNRNLSSSSNDIRYLQNSVMQINDKLNQILSSSASPSGVVCSMLTGA